MMVISLLIVSIDIILDVWMFIEHQHSGFEMDFDFSIGDGFCYVKFTWLRKMKILMNVFDFLRRFLVRPPILFLFLLFAAELSTADDLNSVREEVYKINRTSNFEIKTVPYSYFLNRDEVTDNGIELKGYYQNGKLRKMEYFIGLSVWNIPEEYYFDGSGKLVFVFYKKYITMGEDGRLKRPVKIAESRNYFKNNKLYKIIGEPDDGGHDFVRQAESLKKDLKNFK